MKRSLFLLILISPIFLFCTCHKQKETILDFTFTDLNSKIPIQDIEIYLQEFDQDQFGNITNMRTLDSYKTNAMGNLYVKLKYLNLSKHHSIEWQKPSECYEASGYKIIEESVNKYERTLIARGVLKEYIKNVFPFNNNDTIYHFHSFKRNFDPIWWDGVLIGPNINENKIIGYEGNAKFYFHWKVIKNGIISIHTDSITTIPCDTTRFYINY